MQMSKSPAPGAKVRGSEQPRESVLNEVSSRGGSRCAHDIAHRRAGFENDSEVKGVSGIFGEEGNSRPGTGHEPSEGFSFTSGSQHLAQLGQHVAGGGFEVVVQSISQPVRVTGDKRCNSLPSIDRRARCAALGSHLVQPTVDLRC